MSEFKVGDKVLVEGTVKDVDEGWCFVDNNYWTNKVHRFPTEKKTYEDGLREAWELAKKIICNIEYGGLHESELEQIFGYNEFDDVLKNYTPQEAAAKIAEWEGKKELCVGDIVTDSYGNKDVVTGIGGQKETDTVCILRANGYATTVYKKELTKTGRTIDIAGLLAQIGGTE